ETLLGGGAKPVGGVDMVLGDAEALLVELAQAIAGRRLARLGELAQHRRRLGRFARGDLALGARQRGRRRAAQQAGEQAALRSQAHGSRIASEPVRSAELMR